MTKDKRQYGSERGLSVNHYPINMINKILLSVDKNSNTDKYSVLVSMLDASHAFERQSHILGVQSFLDNNIRVSLIPTISNFFQNRKLCVKWKNTFSKTQKVSGGGPQGGTLGILEFISMTNGNLDFLPEDEGFKFVNDTSFLEVLDLLALGLSSFNPKFQVPSDIPPEEGFLSAKNFQTQKHLDTISRWTEDHQMLLNPIKSKYMIVNFCTSLQFRTRLYINDSILDQVQSTRLLGVIISDDLSWQKNTQDICKRANKRMIILRKLREFGVSTKDMLTIYVLYIRGTLEQSSVVWSTSLTKDEEYSFERIQKIAFKIILQDEYVTYENALKLTNLPTIKARHHLLLQKFALKCIKNSKNL